MAFFFDDPPSLAPKSEQYFKKIYCRFENCEPIYSSRHLGLIHFQAGKYTRCPSFLLKSLVSSSHKIRATFFLIFYVWTGCNKIYDFYVITSFCRLFFKLDGRTGHFQPPPPPPFVKKTLSYHLQRSSYSNTLFETPVHLWTKFEALRKGLSLIRVSVVDLRGAACRVPPSLKPFWHLKKLTKNFQRLGVILAIFR